MKPSAPALNLSIASLIRVGVIGLGVLLLWQLQKLVYSTALDLSLSER